MHAQVHREAGATYFCPACPLMLVFHREVNSLYDFLL